MRGSVGWSCVHWWSIVDDDESVRESLPDFGEFGFAVQVFASAEEFSRPHCVPTDVCFSTRMPGHVGPSYNEN